MARTLYQIFRDIWKDKPDKTTPVTAEAMMHIEQGIYDNSNNMALKEIYGDTAISLGRKKDTDLGENSYAVGHNVEASGNYSHAEGWATLASGSYTHCEGNSTKAYGSANHTEGEYSTAGSPEKSVSGAHAEGYGTVVNHNYCHAEGYESKAFTKYSHAEGCQSTTGSETSPNSTQGEHAEGYHTEAVGNGSHAEGYETKAATTACHAEGYQTQAIGDYSHTEGYQTKAYGASNHAEGHETTAGKEQGSVYGAHSEGGYTKALGDYSHAEGAYTEANQSYSHAEGCYTKANAPHAHAEGYFTQAVGQYQHVQGKFNAMNSLYAFIIGNGTSEGERSNACYVDWEGNAWFAGNISNGKYSLNDIGSLIGDEDISNQCFTAINGQAVTITIPISGIAVNGNRIAGGFFVGAVTTNIPPLLLSADISVVQYSDNHTQVEGTAELINTIQASSQTYGSVFKGSIQLSQLAQDSATTCRGTVQITFNLGVDVTTASLALFKSAKYYYPIARVWNNLTEMLESLEQRIVALESSSGSNVGVMNQANPQT